MTDPAISRPARRKERLDSILAALGADGVVEVTTMAKQLDVSVASIRRDLELLEGRNLLVRTHGGAVSRDVSYELPLRYRSGKQAAQKRAIAAEAAARVPAGRSTVGLSGGTTTTEVAHNLLEHADLTVVTNALNIASELVVRTNIRLVITGGVARTQSYELVGPLAEASLRGLNLDVAFLGVDGVSPVAGLTTHQEMEAHTNATLISRARRVIAVADSTKLGKVTFAQICSADEIHELITDWLAPPDLVADLRSAGVTVTIVEDPAS